MIKHLATYLLLTLLLPFLNISILVAQTAEELLQQAQQLEASGDRSAAISIYGKAATSFQMKGKPSEAKQTYNKAIELSLDMGNTNALKIFYTNNGLICIDQEEYDEAVDYFQKCLQINRKQNRKIDIASTLVNIANVQVDNEQPEKALEAALEANTLAREENNTKLLRNTYSLLSTIYTELGDAEKSAENFSLYTAFSRQIQRQDVAKKENEAKQIVNEAKSQLSEIKNQQAQTEQELEKKQKALKSVSDSLQKVEQISREQQMQIDYQSVKIANQNLVRNIFIVIILAFIVVSISIGYSYRQKKRSNKLLAKQNNEIAQQRDTIEAKSNELANALIKIEKQNKDITSSINYAQRIQESLLPNYSDLVHMINDVFILFKPREIVSGDFYWVMGYSGDIKRSDKLAYTPRINPNESGVLISAVDCTGHGVPGAFMSMIGLNLLDTIARTGITQPDLILNELHLSIRHLLKQENNDSRDGMDMAICNISNDGQTVTFAGAKNPIYYITNNELHEIKGDPKPIGGQQKEDYRTFTLHTIKIDSPTCFYIFSDGYADQFGGPDGRRLTSKHFKEILLENHRSPMIQQQEFLEYYLDQWQGTENKAVDDILVIGFRLSGKSLNI